MNKPLRIAIILALTVIVLTPLAFVVYQSMLDAPFYSNTAAFSNFAYDFVFTDSAFYAALKTSAIVATGMTAIAVPLGILLAFLIVRTDLDVTGLSRSSSFRCSFHRWFWPLATSWRLALSASSACGCAI
jgi:ABC-type spermidine/putrescine transport system permease subunit II